MPFQLEAPFQPTGDQPQAIKGLVKSVEQGAPHQVLLGVTGSGKTYTMAQVIQKTQKPTLIIAHNKTLAAQLYQEFRDFFPHNAVSYFVSYYDYYQPEAYIPSSDTYIEKEATINDEIDKLRLATTTNLLTRPDVIVVSSVSCIYNLGSPVEYGRYLLEIIEGERISRETLLLQLSNLQYERSDAELRRGTYRLRGDALQLWPAYQDTALYLDTLEDRIVSIKNVDPISGEEVEEKRSEITLATAPSNINNETPKPKRFIIYPAKHYVINPKTQEEAIAEIESDLNKRVKEMQEAGKPLEAYRLQQKVTYDLEMIKEFGFVNGIENYSRYFDGRKPGDPPFTLLDYFAENARLFNQSSFLTIIDESHMTLPQVRGMHNGDRARKDTLVEYGFRLPSAIDNRPLKFHEFLERNPQLLHVSATPQDWEVSQAGENIVEQLIRPTGLIDPEIELRKTAGQIADLIIEIMDRKLKGQRTLVTTLTKKMAEALTEYLNDQEKVLHLLSKAVQHKEERQSSDSSEKVLWNDNTLPVEQLGIGKIDESLYTVAEIKSELVNKKKAELIEFLPKVAYLHSDIETLERSDILADLRRGIYDVVVGINLLREGLDLPEVTLVAILDADKEGFLRSRTSMIQTIGRAARHSEGRAILYADKMTLSMLGAIQETYRRRTAQIEHNLKHGISPQTISKPIRERMIEQTEEDVEGSIISKIKPSLDKKKGKKTNNQPKSLKVELNKKEIIDLSAIEPERLTPFEKKSLSDKLRRRMKQAANDMDFELAAIIRDTVHSLE